MLDFVKNISPVELIIVLLIITVLFGSKIITSMAKASGESVKEIKNIKKEFTDVINLDNDKSSKS